MIIIEGEENEMIKTYGLIGAMDEEISLMIDHMDTRAKTEKAGITFYSGEWYEQSIVLCKSGVGKVNASICTQIMIDEFGVDQVIFTGVAGGVDPALEIGDIVISKDCVQHDIDASALEALDLKRGEIPFASTSIFPADPNLIQVAESCAQLFSVRVVTGRVLSGDQFIADRDEVKYLFEAFQGACVEMEGAAVAQVCHLNCVPFVIIRSLSDKADGSADVNFIAFTKLASQRSFEMVQNMLKKL